MLETSLPAGETHKGAAFIVAITVAVMLNRYFTLILLVRLSVFPGLQHPRIGQSEYFRLD